MLRNKHLKVLMTIMLLVVVISCQEEPTVNPNKQFLKVEFTDGLNNEERSIVELAKERMIESSSIHNGQYVLECLCAEELNISQDLFNFIRINMAYMNHKIKNGEYLLENKRPKLTSEGESCLKSRPANMELTKVTATDGDNPNDTNGGGYQLEIFEKATDWYKVYEEDGYTIWEYTNTTYAYETRYSWVDDPHIYHYYDKYYVYYAGDMTDINYTPRLIAPPAPKIPIDNLIAYLVCIDTSLPAQLTIYVDQALANTDNAYWGSTAGHCFVGIKQNDNESILGFYPKDGPKDNGPNNSALGDDSEREFDVSITITMSQEELHSVLEYTYNYPNTYDLSDFNCTDFAIKIAALGGLKLPDTYKAWPNGGGSCPGQLGQDIRNMTLPTGASRNTLGGNAPVNTKACVQ